MLKFELSERHKVGLRLRDRKSTKSCCLSNGDIADDSEGHLKATSATGNLYDANYNDRKNITRDLV